MSPGSYKVTAKSRPVHQSSSPRTQRIGQRFLDIDARDASHDQARGVDPSRESSEVAAIPSAHQLRKIGDHESKSEAEHDGRGKQEDGPARDRSEARSSRRDRPSEGHGPPNA